MGLFGGKKTTETRTTTIPGRSSTDSQLLRLLQQFASGSAGQIGDLSKLAAGNIGGPTGADQELIQQSIMRAAQAAQGQLQTQGALLGAQGREQLTSRGMSGSSAEVLQTLLNQLGTQQSIAQSVLGAQQQGGEALMNLPFQRAATQLSANQQLWNQILGAANPTLQYGLQERMAQQSTTSTSQTSGFGLGDLVQLGGLAAGGLGGLLGSASGLTKTVSNWGGNVSAPMQAASNIGYRAF